ncbi:MAG: heavy metal translocating P-type ATPase [Anaerolineae bacterium]
MAEEETRKTLKLEVGGLDCPDCALSLEKAVQGLPGVASAQLIFAASQLIVQQSAGVEVLPDIMRVADSMGHQILVEGEPASERGTEAAGGWRAWLREHRRDLTTVVSALLLVIGLVASALGASPTLVRVLLGAAIIVGALYVARAAWTALRTAHSVDMNTLMLVAAVGAMFVGEYVEGAVTVLLFSIGELLEGYSMDRARNAIRALMGLVPDEAIRIQDGKESRVPVGMLRLGDHIVVRPAERVPMDGQVLQGQSEVNQAPVTGESIPVEKAVGDEVFAGTINGSGVLEVQVTRRAEDNTIARILRMVQDAQAQRAPAQRFVDRFARVYTPIVMGLALLVALAPPLLGLGALDTWVYRALVLLVIACPCALVISTPVAIVSALTRAARSGVLIKGGRYLEQLGSIQVVAFDKTGTLTEGRPYVVAGGCAIHGSKPACDHCRGLVAKAAAVEGRSEHALARAVTEHARALGVGDLYVPAENITAVVGKGIEGLVSGHPVSIGSLAYCMSRHDGEDPICQAARAEEQLGRTVLVIEDACCGESCYLSISDTIREGAAQAVRDLRAEGIRRIVMLTGDNAAVAQDMAAQTGMDEYRAGLLPADKVQAVADLEERYGRVAMVGDGVNDAPALAKATVGIAMGAAGTDSALETADVALMADDLSRLPYAIRLSRRTLGIVRTNIVFALALKALFLILAVSGLATLWMAVLADTGASLLVTLNGMRMLRFERRNDSDSQA